MKKRFMSIALCLVMLLYTGPGILAASETDDGAETVQGTEEVQSEETVQGTETVQSEEVLTDEMIEVIDGLETTSYSQSTLASIGFAYNYADLKSLLANNYSTIIVMNDIQLEDALYIKSSVSMVAISPVTITSRWNRHCIYEPYDSAGNALNSTISIEMKNITLDGADSVGGIAIHAYDALEEANLVGLSIQNCAMSGIEVFADSVTISETNIINCEAGLEGGGISLHCESATITDSNIENCTSSSGGGILVFGFNSVGTLTIANTNIKNCTASAFGGGISANCVSLILSDSNIENCTANFGGGLYLTGYPREDYYYFLTISETRIQNCTATESGGGVYFEYADKIEFQSGTISNNTANNDGGGIGIGTGYGIDFTNKLYVGENAVFSGNTASTGYYMNDADDIALHTSNIKTTNFSDPFTQYAYNNYDIGYTKGVEIGDMATVNFYLSLNDTSPYESMTVFPGEIGILPNAVKDGCIFIGWVDEDYNLVTANTVIDQSTNLYAVWLML